jgi:hypothetical protein
MSCGFGSYFRSTGVAGSTLIALVGFCVIFVSSAAQAAFVTTNETGMDAIYSQGSFGPDPIDIVWNPTISHTDASLLNITSSADLSALFALFDSATTIFAYFVDTISWCGSSSPSFVGCADLPGDDFVVESGVAGGASGAELNSHELGHALGLFHTDPITENLMFSMLNGDVSLTGLQAASVQGAGAQIQGTAPNRFVSITPVLILVPEPGTAVLLTLGLIGLGAVRRSGD